MKGFGADQISKKGWTHEKLKKKLCPMTKYSGEVFNSTSHPSGNLVDGLPLDLHNTDARGFNSYRACAYLCTCLPGNTAGKINSLYN